MNLTHCTLTGVDGVDEAVLGSFDTLIALSDEFPIVEWGFLYSPKRQGQPGRYPSVALLKHAFETLPQNVRVALHVCGDGVHTLIDGFNDDRNTMSDVDVLVEKVSARGGRIQLNFNQTRKPVSVRRLNEMLNLFPALSVITQFNDANQSLWQALDHLRNHAVLSDSSGGNGILSGDYPDAGEFGRTRVGYAGGLSADNLAEQLPKIAAAAGGRKTWIDMEGSLRKTDADSHDWFDLSECRRVLQVVSKFNAQAIEPLAA